MLRGTNQDAVCTKCEILERWLAEKDLYNKRLELENKELKDELFRNEERVHHEEEVEREIKNYSPVGGRKSRRRALHDLSVKYGKRD